MPPTALTCSRCGDPVALDSKALLRVETSPTGEERYVCPGYYDHRKYRACPFRAPVASVPRPPWQALTGTAAAAAAHDVQTHTEP
jgi:hypothetical protein